METNSNCKKRIPVDQTECGKDYDRFSTGAAGILRYRREPDHTMSSATVRAVHWSSAEDPADCEYCGQHAKPLLQLSWERWPEEALSFCCVQRQQLYQLLEEDRCMAGGRCLTSLAAEIGDLHQFDMDWDCAFDAQPKEVIFEEVFVQPALVTDGSSHALSFRLSRAPERCWTAYSRRVAQQHFGRKDNEPPPGPSLDHKPPEFGICDYQTGPDFAQKNYSSGTRLLTAFSDGSAQLFYPSGSLAIVVMVTEDNAKVCMVYDESSAARESTRAIFHSDGRATCYHGNRNAEPEQLGRSVFGAGWDQGAAVELERHWPCSHRPGPPSPQPQRKDSGPDPGAGTGVHGLPSVW
ncbi:uncharacterized protein LOC130539537 isoform X2 [Takifugu flavidus]|uniref:uncharacterized protein LOC130539537 isoform X2 n=1 Tax=Takifugu flavidus TaxID=433684 RepID=UPI002544863E|nr:uncharacterized protein LOC130539537 isoform X2 [Takifugu flavidus]